MKLVIEISVQQERALGEAVTVLCAKEIVERYDDQVHLQGVIDDILAENGIADTVLFTYCGKTEKKDK